MNKFPRWLIFLEDFKDPISNISYIKGLKYSIIKTTDTAYYHTLNSVPINKNLRGKLFQAFEKDNQNNIHEIF